MRCVFFGTYDERRHPRVRVLREGLEAHGHEVTVCNLPVGLDTAARVRLVQQPHRLPLFLARLLAAWARLLWRSRRLRDVDVVVVGYLGTFDVRLARRRFPGSLLVLDQMVSLGETVRDRGLASTSRFAAAVARVLDRLDRTAAAVADIVVVDTEAQGSRLAERHRRCVVHVGAPVDWFRQEPAPAPGEGQPVDVVFFGLYTPLQGAPTIGRALALVSPDAPIRCTMVGDGQDRAATEQAAAGSAVPIRWLDWVDTAALPALVAAHHVCLGIFGTNDKAARVVPNKVYQGAAAGAAIITSDTATQRAVLGDAALYVPGGDAAALARTLEELAGDRDALARSRARARDWAGTAAPERVVVPLLRALEDSLQRSSTTTP